MSIASEIQRITGNVADAYTAASGKGATMPATQNSDNLASTINTISTGVTPTGTKSITANGVYDVTNYASADVQVPTTAPAYYIEKTVNASNTLTNGANTIISLTGIETINPYVLAYAYYHNTNITGVLDLSSITTLSQGACCGTFEGCTGITSVDLSSLTNVNQPTACCYMFQYCTGITSTNLSSLTTVSSISGCTGMFRGCTSLTGNIDLSSLTRVSGDTACDSMFRECTGITSVNLSSLTTVSYTNSCSYMFRDCTSLTSVDLSSLTTVSGSAGCQYMFQNCTGITSVDLSSLVAVTQYNACSNMFSGCTGITTVDLSSLTLATGQSACYGMFYGCTNLTSVDISQLCKLGSSSNIGGMFRNTALTSLSFPNLAYTTTNINSAFANTLQGVTGCTVHFPSDWQTAMASYSNITNGLGGTNTTVLFDLPAVTTLDLSSIISVNDTQLFYFFGQSNYFANITGVDLSSLTTVSGNRGCNSMFQYCTNLTSFNLSSLTTVSNENACASMFLGCTNLTSADLSSLTAVSGYNGCDSMFKNCTGITSVDLSSLVSLYAGNACYDMFSGTAITSFNLPSLKTVTGLQTTLGMLRGCSNVTINLPALKTDDSSILQGLTTEVTNFVLHVPSNFSSTSYIPTGTLFDLPAAVTLTGANTTQYERNPKYDTATALAWRVLDGGTAAAPIIDWTPFYTSTTADPVVGDTIYSDAACTTAVTTIDSIA